MASKYVRDLVRSWLALDVVPFYNTDNEDQNPKDPVWCTVEWGVGSSTRLNYCGHRIESNSFNLCYVSKTGIGDAAALTAAEAGLATLLGRIDAAKKLQFVDWGPPDTFSDDKGRYIISVNVEYEYQA